MGVNETLKIIAQWDGRGVARGTDDTTKRLEGMHRTGSRLDGVFGRLGPTIVGAFSVAAITQIARMGAELASLSARAELTEETFDRLAQRADSTGVAEIEKLRDAVGGTLSDLRLMQSVGAAVDAGLTFEQSRTAVEFLRRYSLAFGKDFNQLVSTIFTGLQRGSTLMLDDAGIIIDASSAMFQGLDEIEKKSALVGHAIDLMREKMTLLPEIQSDASTESDRLAASWEKFQIGIGRFLESDIGVLVSVLATSISYVSDEMERASELQEQAQIRQRDARRVQQERNDAYRESHRQFWDSLGNTVENFAERVNAATLPDWLFQLIDPNRGQIDLDGPQRAMVGGDIATSTPRGLPGPITEFQIPTQQGPSGAINIPIEFDFPPDVPEDVALKLLGELPLDPVKATIEVVVAGDLDLVRQLSRQRGEGGVLPTADGGVYDISDLIGDGSGGEVQGLPGSSRGFLDRARDELGRSVDDIDLFADALSRLNPELGSLVGTVNVGVQSLDLMTSATSVLGKAAGAIGVGGALFSLADSIFGWSRDAQERARRNAQLAQDQARAQAELNREIEDAISLTGRFTQSLSGQTDQELRNAFSLNVSIMADYLSTAGLTIENILSRENDLRLELDRKNFDERYDFLELALNQNVTIAKTYYQRITDIELDLRREQGEIIIGAVERQRRDVLQALENSIEAQRQATIRAVGLQFDFREAEIRSRYLPQLQATQSGVGREVLLGQVSRDIETLRRGETAAIEQALNALIEPGNARIDQANRYYDGLVQAVRDAIPDTSQPLVNAIHEQTSDFLEAFRAGEASDPLADLPADLREFTTKFLDGAEAEILARVNDIDLSVTLPTIDLPTITPAAEDVRIGGGVNIDLPPIAPDPTEITASIIHINFPELAPGTAGVTLAVIHLNFPALGPGVENITLSTIHLNFPTLHPGIGEISVGGVSVDLPHLALAWPPLPRWVWPPLPRLEIGVSGNITTTQRVVHVQQSSSSGTTGTAGTSEDDPFIDDGNYDTEEEERANDPNAVIGDGTSGLQGQVANSIQSNTLVRRVILDALSNQG